MNLDQILNFIIPAGILLFGLFYFYKLLQDPIDKFIDWIKGLMGKGKDKFQEGGEEIYSYYPKN